MLSRFTKINSGLILGIMITLFSSGLVKAAVGDIFNDGNIYYTVLDEKDNTYTCSVTGGATSNPKEDFIIPETVTYKDKAYTVVSIGYRAFSGRSDFDGKLIIGRSIQSIEDYAFYSCKGFTGDLEIPNSVKSIGSSAFSYCSGFDGKLIIGGSIQSIGDNAFYNCSGFTGNLTIGESVQNIGDYAFSYCSGFTGSLTIPGSVNYIGSYAFNECKGFTGSLTIPGLVNSIGKGAFYGCSGFDGELTIQEGVKSIESSAFWGCSGFTGSLTIPGSVNSIGSYAFNECKGFTGSLTIPGSVNSIGKGAFSFCTGFDGSLTISEGVISIGETAFNTCKRFTGSLTIPGSVTSIGDLAFWDCSGFDGSLTIPGSITSIEFGTFWGCSGLTGSLTIPRSVTSIGLYAFFDCNKIDRILSNIKDNIPEQNNTMFPFSFHSDKAIYVPDEKYDEYVEKWSDWNIAKMSEILPKGTLIIEDFSINAGKTMEIPVNIEVEGDDNFTYNGFQFDVTIPEGLSIEKVTLSSEISNFSLVTNIVDGKTRIQAIDLKYLSSSNVLNEIVTLKIKASRSAIATDNAVISVTNGVFFVNSIQNEEIKATDSECSVRIINTPITEEDVTVTPDWRPDNDDLLEDNENKRKENEIYVGESLVYTAKVDEKVTNPELKWSLKEGTNYVTIEDLGDNRVKVTGKAFGTAVLEAKSEVYDFTYTYSVTVIPMPVTIEITVPEDVDVTSLKTGDEFDLGYTISPDDVTTTGEVTLEWSVNPSSGIAKVDGSGHVTTLATGDATITLTAKYKDMAAQNRYQTVPSDKLEINITSVLITGIKISSISMEGYSDKHNLKQSEELDLKATVMPENANFSEIEWSCENSDVKLESTSNGTEVTLSISGNASVATAVITARVKEAPEITSIYEINIENRVLGDADDDKETTTTDALIIAAEIQHIYDPHPVENFCFINSDVDLSGEIDAWDLNATILIVRNIDPFENLPKSLPVSSSVDFLGWSLSNSDNGTILNINLDNASSYSILQADLLLPERVVVREISGGTQLNGHILSYNMIDEKTLRVLIYSLANATFNGDGENLLTISLDSSTNAYDIEITGIKAGNTKGNRFMLEPRFEGNENSDITGMETDTHALVIASEGCVTVLNGTGNSLTVTNTSGQVIYKGKINSEHEVIRLLPGIYVVGLNESSKKVLVK